MCDPSFLNEKPVETNFELKLVPYSEDLVWQYGEVSYCESVAFVHIFFVYVSSVEEYRLNVRHRVSEWFGQLNKAQNSHWMIIFDSSKAKEKKNRGSILEKLKSDFAKHQEKLVEVCDGGSSTEMTQKISQTFIASLDRFLLNYEQAYAQLKGNWENDSWNLTTFVNQQFNLCRFLWNLSLYDAVSAELDKIDSLVNEIIRNSSENSPQWLQNLKNQSFGETCPLLRLLTHVEGVAENVSLIELRTFLLANQILSFIFIYNNRRSRTASPASPRTTEATQSMLKNDFANIMLKCASCTIQNLRAEIYELGVEYDQILFRVWISVVLTDVIELVEQLFVPLRKLTQDQNIVCHLVSLKCNSLYEIFACSESKPKKAIASWLKATVAQRNADILGSKTAELLNVLRRTFLDRTQLEGSPDQGKNLEELVEYVLIDGIQIFKEFGWEKSASVFLKFLFNVYKENSSENDKKATFMKLLNNLLENCPITEVLIENCETGMEMFLKDMKENRDTWMKILLLMSTRSEEIDKRRKYGEMLIQEAKKDDNQIKIYNFDFGVPTSFPILVKKVSELFIFSLLDAQMSLKITLENRFEFSLKDCTVKLFFKKLNKYTTEPLGPLFSCHMPDSNTSRCTAKTKGLRAREDYKEIMKVAVNEVEEGSPVFVLDGPVDLDPGLNVFELKTVADQVGSFALNHIEITVGPSLKFLLHYQQSIVDFPTLENVYLSIDLRKPNVTLKQKPDTLLAGIAQMISLNVTAGTNAVLEPSELKIKCKGEDPVMEFLSDSEWTNELVLGIPSLEPYKGKTIDVYLYLPIDEMHFSAEKTILTTKQLQVEWLNEKWIIELGFLPILSLKMSTTIVETKVLFSLDISRSDDFNFFDILLLEANLNQKQSIMKPPFEAKLMNPKLEKIEAHSSHKIVWELPDSKIDKSIPLKHDLKLTYRAEKKSESKNSSCFLPEFSFEKDYFFDWKQELGIGKAEYDICAQIIPAENIALCRVNQECGLLVSLKLISNHSDSRIVATVDADPHYWSLINKCAVVHMKESGIGQTTFTIIPRQIGLLPFPSVYIHRCNPDYNEKDPITEATVLGERLNSYHRFQGKQMRVIQMKPAAEDTGSMGSTSTTATLKTAMKRAFKTVASRMDREKD
ncbi:hypothetical protein FO519_004491 [Halicephalobus sp. NKZ332]|nr:hypothetical protein FO519_004491 [Halicephalobus sp. NKZ332]